MIMDLWLILIGIFIIIIIIAVYLYVRSLEKSIETLKDFGNILFDIQCTVCNRWFKASINDQKKVSGELHYFCPLCGNYTKGWNHK